MSSVSLVVLNILTVFIWVMSYQIQLLIRVQEIQKRLESCHLMHHSIRHSSLSLIPLTWMMSSSAAPVMMKLRTVHSDTTRDGNMVHTQGTDVPVSRYITPSLLPSKCHSNNIYKLWLHDFYLSSVHDLQKRAFKTFHIFEINNYQAL